MLHEDLDNTSLSSAQPSVINGRVPLPQNKLNGNRIEMKFSSL